MTAGGTKNFTYSLEHIEDAFFNFDSDGSETSTEEYEKRRAEWKLFRLRLHQLSTGYLKSDSDKPNYGEHEVNSNAKSEPSETRKGESHG